MSLIVGVRGQGPTRVMPDSAPPLPPSSWPHGPLEPQRHTIRTPSHRPRADHRHPSHRPRADHRHPSPGPGPVTGTGHATAGEDRLHRCRNRRMLAGVAAGLADYFDIDPTLVRIAFVALALLGGLAVPLYLAGWLLIPEEETDVSVAEELLARERAR